MAMWSPWRGCHRVSEGCKFCYIHKGDAKRGVDTEFIMKTENFDAPIRKDKSGRYKMKPGQTVYVCFSNACSTRSIFNFANVEHILSRMVENTLWLLRT